MAARLRRVVLGLLLPAGILLLLLGFFAEREMQAALARPLTVSEEGALHVVTPGASLDGVLAALEARGHLADRHWLRLHARLTGLAGRIQSGEYRLVPGMTAGQLLLAMVEGRTVRHRITLIEGWRFEEVMQALAVAPSLRHTLTGQDGAEVMRAIGAEPKHAEGQFFPATYEYVLGMSDADILRRAHARLVHELAERWAGRAPDLPLASPEEALTLASIIEKETARPEERPLIAGVFIRRLRLGMRLQTDPTVIYGLGTAFAGNLTRAHLTADGPYNTYARAGLPPTPIALAGAAAIDAALHPADGEALYFVARGDGSHEFSSDYAAHAAAVDRFQRAGRAP